MLTYSLLIAISTVLTLAGIISVWRLAVRHRRAAIDDLPLKGTNVAVSVLKPLCGKDDRLEENLETFFRQDYPSFEIVFGIQGEQDPAIEVVERLQRRFPEVDSKLVIHEGGLGINPKVSNLRAMLRAVTSDVVVISDSNVSVPPTYLRVLVETLKEEGVELVTNVFAGVGEQTLGARLENMHINGLIAGSVTASEEFTRHTLTVGKSMAFRLSLFERLGGFDSISNVLAEDYIMGRMFRSAGYKTRLAPMIIENVCVRTPLRAFVQRHLRWGMMRWRLQPLLYPLEGLANPIAIALLAPLFGAPLLGALGWAIALIALRDTIHWLCMRGTHGLLAILPLGAMKDLIMVFVWLTAPFHRHVSWRGNRVRLSAGTLLYSTSPRRGGPSRSRLAA